MWSRFQKEYCENPRSTENGSANVYGNGCVPAVVRLQVPGTKPKYKK